MAVEALQPDPFRALADATPDAIVTAGADDHVRYVNPAAERLLGRSSEELIGRPVDILMPEDQRAAHRAGFERYVRTGEAHLVGQTVEVSILGADGTPIPVELSLGASGAGEDVVITAVLRDISERVRRRRSTAAQLAVTAVLTGPDLPDREARVVQALTEALGWDVGALWLVSPDDRLRPAALWETDPPATEPFARSCREGRFARGEGVPGRVWDGGEPLWIDDLTQESWCPRVDGARASGLRTGVSLPLRSEGQGIGVLEVFSRVAEPLDEELRDVLGTVASQVAESLRREQHARELGRSNAELDEFAHIVAHDLAEPLNTIAGFGDLLLRRPAVAAGEEREFTEAIVTSARRGQGLLGSLLALARAGAGQPERVAVDLDALVAEVLVGLRGAIDAAGATVELGPLPSVTADPVLLGQVFQNLLANAVKFHGDDPPRVRVTGEETPSYWLVRVSDNGRGIPGDSPVFDMFQRSGDPGEAGMGIGLAVCRRVVERHGGRIWFDSRPGAGTTFSFTLPR